MRILACLAAASFALAGAPLHAVDAPSALAPTDEHRAMLQCAAAFAIVATEQTASTDASLAFPPLGYRGKEYFVLASARVMADTGLTKEAVRDLLVADVAELQGKAAAGDPDEVMRQAMGPCLPRLDAMVPPLESPDLLQCTAILKIAYEDVHAREGLSPQAQDLATLASVLSSREREALMAKGGSGDDADRAIAEAHDALLAETLSPNGVGAERYDIAHCWELAKPDPKSHY